jgi:hypothetical protein
MKVPRWFRMHVHDVAADSGNERDSCALFPIQGIKVPLLANARFGETVPLRILSYCLMTSFSATSQC